MHDGQHEEVDAWHQQKQGPMLGRPIKLSQGKSASQATLPCGTVGVFPLDRLGKTASCAKMAKAKESKE